LTPPAPKHSISPESSDGFASVGTILPKEKAALLPGGLFVLCQRGSDADAARVRVLAGYKDFLSLWKNADPEIPIETRAKAEYAKLE